MPARGSRRVGARSAESSRTAASDIYDSLVSEAISATDLSSHDERPLKKRRAGPRPRAIENTPLSVQATTPASSRRVTTSTPTVKQEQESDHETVSSFKSEDDGLEFEDVDMAPGSPISSDSDEELEDVSISLGQHKMQAGSGSSARRKTASRIEKRRRVEIHKLHIVALLGHCMIVNTRCNDPRVHTILRRYVTPKTRDLLYPNAEHTQFQQNRAFLMGLQRASEAFRGDFEVDASGMRRAYWADEEHKLPPIQPSDVVDRKEFIEAAKHMKGSQDTGNQLFCAMLRGVGMEARIVCSLQVLPLSNTMAAPSTPSKVAKPVVFAIAPDYALDKLPNESRLQDRAAASIRGRIGRPGFSADRPVAPTPKPKRVEKLLYPIFWTEVYNTACQKWTPVDPVVTHSIEKATKIVPPGAYTQNQLVYAMAFNRDGSVKDVTRRYAKQYNAKTRRLRIESVGDAEAAWFAELMRKFARLRRKDSDRIEDGQLTSRVNREAMPTNIQDFIGHPIYALERHLKRHEVIHPRHESGMVNAGTAGMPKMEPVFRRSDVHECRSADQWYRREGRVVKSGQQPVKIVPARVKRRDSDDEGADEPDTTALYMNKQTELYIPPPVVRGKVPRNGFGNLDVYVPSMVPAGGAHIKHPLAKQAAQILHVDAVDAVTGFKFTGRKGTTIIEGVVVPERHDTAVREVIEGLIWQELDERSRERSALALRLWKRFLQGLRIAERVASYATEPIEVEEIEIDPATNKAWYADEDVPLHTAGLYSLEELVSQAKAAKARPKPRRHMADSDDDEDMDEADEYVETDDDPADGIISGELDDTQHVEDDGGGFIADDEPGYEGGGFVVDETLNEEGGFVPDIEGGFAAGQDLINHDEPATAPIDLTGDTPEHMVISTSTSDFEQRASSVWRQPHYQKSAISDDALSHESKASRSHPDHTDDESLKSHDPDDDEAEPDWLESE